MRRKERMVTEEGQIETVLKECQVCRLGFTDADGVYIVPLNFGYTYENGSLTLYFHGAGEGKKLDLIRNHPQVGFEMDCSHRLVEGRLACQYSYYYASIIGQGQAEIVTDKNEKIKALGSIMKQLTGKQFEEFEKNEKLERAVSVIKVTAAKLTCKRHI